MTRKLFPIGVYETDFGSYLVEADKMIGRTSDAEIRYHLNGLSDVMYQAGVSDWKISSGSWQEGLEVYPHPGDDRYQGEM